MDHDDEFPEDAGSSVVVLSDDEQEDERLRAQLEEEGSDGDDDDIINGGEVEFLDDDEMLVGEEDVEEDTSLLTFREHDDAVLGCCLLSKDVLFTAGQDDSCYAIQVAASSTGGSVSAPSDAGVRPAASAAAAGARGSGEVEKMEVEGDDESSGGKDKDKDEQTRQDAPQESSLDVRSSELLKKHQDSVVDVLPSADRKLVASVGYDGLVQVYRVDVDTPDFRHIHTLEGPGAELEWCAWHPRGPVLLGGSADGTVWLWHAERGECMQVYSGHQDGVTCGGFVFGGKLIATGGKDGMLILWAPKTGQSIDRVQVGHEGEELTAFGGTCEVQSSDADSSVQRMFAVGTSLGAVHLCTYDSDKDKAKVVQKLSPGHEDAVEAVSFQPSTAGLWQKDSGVFLATAGLDGKVKLWNLKNFFLVHDIVAHECAGVTSLKWLRSGELFVTGALDWTARVFSPHTGDCLHTFTGHRDAILAVDVLELGAVSSNTNNGGEKIKIHGEKVLEKASEKRIRVLTASDDQTAKLWEYGYQAGSL